MHIINNAQVSITADLWFITGVNKKCDRDYYCCCCYFLWWIMVDADINMRLESAAIEKGADVRFYSEQQA